MAEDRDTREAVERAAKYAAAATPDAGYTAGMLLRLLARAEAAEAALAAKTAERKDTETNVNEFFKMGYDAFWKGDRCPEGANQEQTIEWKRGRDEAIHRAMKKEYAFD